MGLLDGKVVVVTGGGHGIGRDRATAQRLVETVVGIDAVRQ